MKIIIGIDPGAKGGVAAVRADDMSVVFSSKRLHDNKIQSIFDWVRTKYSDEDVCAYLEDVHSMPKQGVRSMFSFGRDFGFWTGVLYANRVPTVFIQPQKWQKIILPMAGATTKEKSIRFASAAFPDVDLVPTGARTPSDGIADALCIAYYGAKIEQARRKIG